MKIPPTLYSSMHFNFLYADRYVFPKGWFYLESKIPYCITRYMLKGSAVFIIDGVEHIIHENEIAYLPEGCKLECHALSDEVEFISIRFVTTLRLDNNDFLQEFFHINPITRKTDEVVRGYFWEVYRNATSNNSSRLLRIRGNLELIMAYLVEQDPEAVVEESDQPVADLSIEGIRRRMNHSTLIKRDPRIQVVVDYLIFHPTEPFDTAFLSEMAQMSPSTLRRLFKEHTGKSPGDFVKDLRMVTAARRLLTTDLGVSQIAYEVGYDDPNYFARMFKKSFGISPREYRKASQE